MSNTGLLLQGCQAGAECWLILEGQDAWGNGGAEWGLVEVSVGSPEGSADIMGTDEASGGLLVGAACLVPAMA